MWIYDLASLRFLAVNDAATSLYGYCEAEFLKMTIEDIRLLEDVPSLISRAERIRLNFNHQYHWSGTWRHKKKNGQLMYVEVSSHEILFDRKKAELVLTYDVTDTIHQEQKLYALNQDLEKKVMFRTNDLLQLNNRLIDQNKIIKSANLELFTLSTQLQEANFKAQEHAELKNRFVSMASHEFQTPLANIAFSAGFIRCHYSKLEPQNIIKKLQDIEKHVAHMAALLDDVLTIEKSDAVRLEVKNDSLDLIDFIEKISEDVQTATGNSHKIRVAMHENVTPQFHTDVKFLRNILTNLLSNAIKYSPGQKHINFNIYTIDDTTCFEIADNGLGINTDELSKIFEPFYRTDEAENIMGSGLGLSIVKRAVDLLDGKIEVKSEIGVGSVFTVILPAEMPNVKYDQPVSVETHP
jgi:PAS domain S-box-containing protein